MNASKIFFAPLLAFVLLACGCTSARTLRVDAISAPRQLTARTCAIMPANPSLPEGDLRFAEQAAIVEKALASRGYKRVSDSATADVIIAIDASVSGPQRVAVARYDPPFPEEGGFYFATTVPVRNRAGTVCLMRTRFWNPPCPYGPDMREGVYTQTYFEKRLAVTAFANASAKELPQLWSVIVSTSDEDGDLRSALPAMAVAAARYVESDTGKEVLVRLGRKDPEVVRVTPANQTDASDK
jgi:hypothetical protein